ncbi:MAG: hypothetical protein R8M11_00740, partial [Gallionella sp.]
MSTKTKITATAWHRHSDSCMPVHGECGYGAVGHYNHRKILCDFNPSPWVGSPTARFQENDHGATFKSA